MGDSTGPWRSCCCTPPLALPRRFVLDNTATLGPVGGLGWLSPVLGPSLGGGLVEFDRRKTPVRLCRNVTLSIRGEGRTTLVFLVPCGWFSGACRCWSLKKNTGQVSCFRRWGSAWVHTWDQRGGSGWGERGTTLLELCSDLPHHCH
jgi:hypothetical protein